MNDQNILEHLFTDIHHSNKYGVYDYFFFEEFPHPLRTFSSNKLKNKSPTVLTLFLVIKKYSANPPHLLER